MNSDVTSNTLHTLEESEITLGTRLKIEPLKKTNLSADMAILNLQRRPYFNTVNDHISYKFSVMNTLTITETKLLVPVSKLDNKHPWSYLQTTRFTCFWHDVWQKHTHWQNLNMFLLLLFVCLFSTQKITWGYFYNSLYGEVPPKRGTFFRLQVYE